MSAAKKIIFLLKADGMRKPRRRGRNTKGGSGFDDGKKVD